MSELKPIKTFLYEGALYITFDLMIELTGMRGDEIRSMHTKLGGRSINRRLYFEFEKMKGLIK